MSAERPGYHQPYRLCRDRLTGARIGVSSGRGTHSGWHIIPASYGSMKRYKIRSGIRASILAVWPPNP